MAHPKEVTAWLTLTTAVIVLYTCVPPLFFNDGNVRIAGMPELLFWFTLLPFVIPALIGALYLYDSKLIHDRIRPPVKATSQNGKLL